MGQLNKQSCFTICSLWRVLIGRWKPTCSVCIKPTVGVKPVVYHRPVMVAVARTRTLIKHSAQTATCSVWLLIFSLYIVYIHPPHIQPPFHHARCSPLPTHPAGGTPGDCATLQGQRTPDRSGDDRGSGWAQPVEESRGSQWHDGNGSY